MSLQREQEIDFLEAQEQIDEEWAEFMAEWLGERDEPVIEAV